LVCVDGLASYVTAVRRVFRLRTLTGKPGRPRLVLPQTVLLAQVIKHTKNRRVVGVSRRVVVGTVEAVERVLAATHTGRQINTAYIERLNATFRACLVPLTRRGRRLVHDPTLLQAGMFLGGTAYNFCWGHRSLRVRVAVEGLWQERTPAMAAGLTDHVWTVQEVLRYRVPPAPYVAPKRRGRPPKPPQRDEHAQLRGYGRVHLGRFRGDGVGCGSKTSSATMPTRSSPSTSQGTWPEQGIAPRGERAG
jgi:hypothetical protein